MYEIGYELGFLKTERWSYLDSFLVSGVRTPMIITAGNQKKHPTQNQTLVSLPFCLAMERQISPQNKHQPIKKRKIKNVAIVSQR